MLRARARLPRRLVIGAAAFNTRRVLLARHLSTAKKRIETLQAAPALDVDRGVVHIWAQASSIAGQNQGFTIPGWMQRAAQGLQKVEPRFADLIGGWLPDMSEQDWASVTTGSFGIAARKVLANKCRLYGVARVELSEDRARPIASMATIGGVGNTTVVKPDGVLSATIPPANTQFTVSQWFDPRQDASFIRLDIAGTAGVGQALLRNMVRAAAKQSLLPSFVVKYADRPTSFDSLARFFWPTLSVVVKLEGIGTDRVQARAYLMTKRFPNALAFFGSGRTIHVASTRMPADQGIFALRPEGLFNPRIAVPLTQAPVLVEDTAMSATVDGLLRLSTTAGGATRVRATPRIGDVSDVSKEYEDLESAEPLPLLLEGL